MRSEGHLGAAGGVNADVVCTSYSGKVTVTDMVTFQRAILHNSFVKGQSIYPPQTLPELEEIKQGEMPTVLVDISLIVLAFRALVNRKVQTQTWLLYFVAFLPSSFRL